MAVPGHDAAGLDGELAEAQLAALDVGWLLAEIDRAERDVGEADGLMVDHRADVGLHLVGGAFAGDGARRYGNRRKKAGENEAPLQGARIIPEHVMSPLYEPHRRLAGAA